MKNQNFQYKLRSILLDIELSETGIGLEIKVLTTELQQASLVVIEKKFGKNLLFLYFRLVVKILVFF